MKIGINGRFLTKPYTGIGQYTKNLVQEMALCDPGLEFIVALHENAVHDSVKEDSFPKNVKFVHVPEKGVASAGLKKTYWEQISVPALFRKRHVDIAWFPYPSNPWYRDWKIPTALTVHDCIPWQHREYRPSLTSKMYHRMSKKAVKNADLVLTVSNFSRDEIVDVCKVPEEKIKVIYNDADAVFKKKPEMGFLKKLDLKKEQYFLYVGGYDERKNVEFLLKQHSRKWPLVMLGGKALAKGSLYKSFDLEDEGVLKTGFLEGKELAALYSGCRAFVSMSKHEGFNIPIVEAANCGAALILSDIPVHREIAGDYAHYVDLKDGSLADVMEGSLKKSTGLAKKFSWKKSAQEVLDSLKNL